MTKEFTQKDCESCDQCTNYLSCKGNTKCRVVNGSTHSFDVYIGRGSIWGNPFPIENKSRKERDRVCDLYEKYFWSSDLPNHLHELKGKTLGCHCKPLRCHGDFLAREVNKL